MALSTQARGNNNILANRIVVDMSEVISDLNPSAAPLLQLTKKLGTKECSNPKFEWMEDDIMGRWTTSVNAQGAGDTTVAVAAGTVALFAVNDLVKVVTTGEILRVTGISTDSLTVTRAFGVTAAGAITAGGKLINLGNANMQGSGAPAEKYNNPVPMFNYTQIFKTPFSVTNTLDATELYGQKEVDRLRKKKGIEHAQSIELSLLFGERKMLTAGVEQPITATGGVLQFLAGCGNSLTKALASTTSADFELFCEKVFTYGSKEKVVLSSPNLITLVNSFGLGRLQVTSNETAFGMKVTRYETPHGDLMFVKHPLLTQGYSGYGIVLDMEELKYRPLRGRDTVLKTNLQLPDEDGTKDMYITEAGLELRMQSKHGLIVLS